MCLVKSRQTQFVWSGSVELGYEEQNALGFSPNLSYYYML